MGSPAGIARESEHRCKPDDDKKETYARILAKQSDLTKRLHAAGYL
ncbi:MAG: hypothetical protein ABIP85_20625 [Chthoniobacteraceae bacterium]